MSKGAAASRQVVLVKVDSPIGEVFVVAQQVNSIPENRKAVSWIPIFPDMVLPVSVIRIRTHMFLGLPDPDPSLFLLRCWGDWNNASKIKF